MSEKNFKNRADRMKSAVAAWDRDRRRNGELRPDSRNRVLQESMNRKDRETLPSLSSLFPAYGRMAAAAVLPAGLLAVVLALSLGGGSDLGTMPAPELSANAITVEKVGDQVVFKIANGNAEHSISKSNTPRSFDPGNAVPVRNGSYRDSMIENGDLFFYRID